MSEVIFRQGAVSIRSGFMTDRKPARSKAARRSVGDAKAPRLNRDIQVRIGDRLRALYDDVVDQGVPDRFATLLRQFDDQPNESDEQK